MVDGETVTVKREIAQADDVLNAIDKAITGFADVHAPVATEIVGAAKAGHAPDHRASAVTNVQTTRQDQAVTSRG
jgi:hypothetical protein